MVLTTETETSVRAEQCASILGCSLVAEHQEVRANRVDVCGINHVSKRVITLEMSYPFVTNPEKKEKITQYGPLRWELEQKYQG